MDTLDAEPRRLAEDDPENPFGVEVIDCRPVVLGLTSTTTDPSIGESFLRLRGGDGRRHIGRVPEHVAEVTSQLALPWRGGRLEGAGHLAEEMEDKWDLFAYEDVLYIARSWTGELVYAVDLAYDDGALLFPRIRYRAEVAQGEPGIVEFQVAYLIATYVLGIVAPFPVPAIVADDPEQIALYGFAEYGRDAFFGLRG